MHIVIVGAGLVGTTLAERLCGDGHDVSLVDAEPGRLRSVSENLDLRIVEGNGATANVLRQARIGDADVVVAATNSDETNMIVALLASSLFGVPRIVARLHAADHVATFELISRDHAGDHICVNPEQAAVDRIAALLEVRGAVDVVSFMDGELLVAGFRMNEDSGLVGVRVGDLQQLFAATRTMAVAIHRKDGWLIPGESDGIEDGDLVYFAIAREHFSDVLEAIGIQPDPRRSVMIAGAGAIGIELARRLESLGVAVSLIEEDEALARRAAELLTRTTVIRGAPTDRAVLEEEEIDRVASFVAVTDNHESNLVAGLMAKRLGAGRSVVLVDNPALVELVEEIGIDAIISPRVLAIGLTLDTIRGGRVRSVAQLLADQIEIVEAEPSRRSRLTAGTLAEVRPPGTIVAALRRGEKLLVPGGTDRVEAGDRVLLITKTENASKLADFLAE